MRTSATILLVGALAGLGLAVPVMPAAQALASTLYVGGANCSDTGQGTQAQPYCTLVKAGTVAQSGQTVQVAAGTYTGTVSVANSGTAGSPIIFRPAPGAAVTVTGGLYGFVLSGRQYVTVHGFTVTGTTTYGIYVSSSGNITVEDNTVTYAGQPQKGSTAAGIYLSGTSTSTVRRNVTEHNSDSGIYLGSGSTGNLVTDNESSLNAQGWQRNANGINVIGSGNSVLRNVTHDNEDSGIQFYPGGNNNLAASNVTYDNGDHGIDDLNVTGGRLIGNTVYRNCTSGINVEGTSGHYTVVNNVAVDNAVYPAYQGIACGRRAGNIGIWDSAPPTTTVDHNLVWLTKSGTMYVFGSSYSSLAAMRQATGQEASGKQADPRFANAAGWDLRLTASSPAIDTADSGVSGEQLTDVLGNGRVDDLAVPNTGTGPRGYDDLGGYEYQPSGTSQPPVAAVSVTPSSGTVPLAVTADGSGSSDPQGQTLTYTFDFGDGTVVGPQPAATASHTYSATGTFTVTLTVRDTGGMTGTAQGSVSVSAAAQPPTAALSVSPSSGTAPLPVTADGSGSSDPQGQALTYTFDFGDGTVVGPQSAATASHTYGATGTFTVTLTVRDTGNLVSTAQRSVTVTSGGGGGTPAVYVNQIATNYSTSVHTSGSVQVWRTGGVGAGHLMAVVVQLTGTTTGTVSGTDDAGDALTVASDVADGAGNRLVVLSGVAATGLAAGARITATFPSAATYRMTGDEVSGVSTVDRHAAAAGSGSAYSSGSSGTTARASEFVFGVAALVGGTSATWGPGWTGLTTYTVGSNALARAFQIPPATGSFTASGSTAATGWLATVVSFT